MSSNSPDLPPWAGEISGVRIRVDLDPREEGTVELSTHLWPADPVHRRSALHQLPCLFVGCQRLLAVAFGRGRLTFGLLPLATDAVLLALQQIEGEAKVKLSSS